MKKTDSYLDENLLKLKPWTTGSHGTGMGANVLETGCGGTVIRFRHYLL
jgi:hypothetical protein